MANETFSVDTKVFRELGELLVGKSSTALAELIKNAYDADAQNVVVLGRQLDSPEGGSIQIVDDGIGMDAEQFRKGFLTIAGRQKGDGSDLSPVFKRTYTGEKGVGRLAARKLGRHLTIESWPYDGNGIVNGELLAKPKGVGAVIDWDAVENCRYLNEVETAGAVQVNALMAEGLTPKAGTVITLTKLGTSWSTQDVSEFQLELLSLLPLPTIVASVPATFGDRLLFGSLAGERSEGQGSFTIHYEGDFYAVDAPRAADPAGADWVVEIDADTARGSIEFVVSPSLSVSREYQAERASVTLPIATGEPAVSFKARIYERTGQVWGPAVRGIKVYMEGFRVLPYGGPADDWLMIDQDVSERSNMLRGLTSFEEWLPVGRPKEGLASKRNSSYMGAVLLTKKGAPNLRALVNREGFVPSPEFSWLTSRVRIGVDLVQRVRYAATQDIKSARKRYLAETRERSSRDLEQAPSVVALRDAAVTVSERVGLAREALARGDLEATTSFLAEADVPQKQVRSIVQEMGVEQSMYRILASVGAQLSAFTHEINSLVSLSATVARQLERLRTSPNLTTSTQNQLAAVYQRASDLHHALESQAIYLTDISGIEARRRRGRLSFAERLGSAIRLLQGAITRAGVKIESKLPRDLQSPAMFPAELTAIFTNLLSNAVKFSGAGGKILVSGSTTDVATRIIVENTGTAVDLSNSEKWFEPFASTTADVEAALGQGMGMGLTITRGILDEYGASIAFVPASPGYATAVELLFPKR
jgi:signal transduction histidine kinase